MSRFVDSRGRNVPSAFSCDSSKELRDAAQTVPPPRGDRKSGGSRPPPLLIRERSLIAPADRLRIGRLVFPARAVGARVPGVHAPVFRGLPAGHRLVVRGRSVCLVRLDCVVLPLVTFRWFYLVRFIDLVAPSDEIDPTFDKSLE
jgi:hypothetical protein